MQSVSGSELKRLEALLRLALARTGTATPPLSATAQTIGVGVATVDTGFAPPPGTSAKLDGIMNVHDASADTTSSKNLNASMRNFGGTVAIAGAPIIGGTTGDASLSTAAVTLTVSGGTLHVTFTPPAGYVGTLQWLATITPTIN